MVYENQLHITWLLKLYTRIFLLQLVFWVLDYDLYIKMMAKNLVLKRKKYLNY